MNYPGTILKRNSEGEAVAAVQAALGVQQTKYFGPTTEENVTKFQRGHGLTPDGQVGPKTWNALFAPALALTDLGAKALSLALRQVGVHEQPLGSNSSPLIDQWNQRAGEPEGSPWCAAFATSMIDDAAKALGVPNPVPLSGSSSALYRWARNAGRLVALPQPGDLALVIGGDTGHYHTLFCAGPPNGERFPTVEGNSNNDGSANGVEVAHRVPGRRLVTCHFVRL